MATLVNRVIAVFAGTLVPPLPGRIETTGVVPRRAVST